jgi:flagellar L-ring protein precursor FlgH
MHTALLISLCLAADVPGSFPSNEAVSSPLPASAPANTPARVLREDEKPVARATRSATAAALDSQAAAAHVTVRGHLTTGCIFEPEEPKPRQFAIHDLVTIVVSESSKSKSTADAKADKDYSMASEVGAFMTLDPTSLSDGVQLAPEDLPAFEVSSKKGFKGKGNFNRSDDFTARVTAEIVEIRPNGLLVLEARREIVNDGESQVIQLSGICRPEDIDTNNQVLSQRVADAVVKKMTTGQLRDTSEKGFLARILDAVFAF